MQDYYASTRTNVVLAWALSNGVLAAAILHGYDGTSFTNESTRQSKCKRDAIDCHKGTMLTRDCRTDMLAILVLVAVLSVFRFVASTAYRLVRLVSTVASALACCTDNWYSYLVAPFPPSQFAG